MCVGSVAPSRESLVSWYQTMLLIRVIEERLAAAVTQGELPGPVHSSVGQEAIAVGVCAALRPDDWIASTHRGHGHFIARGGDVRALAAEVFGRATGACRGKGGSMHIADLRHGILGAQGIVGAGIAIGTGAALTQQMRGQGGVAVAFFGDGASNQGVLLEALNLAAIWQLPLVLVCENNGWSEFTRADALIAGSIASRGAPMGVPGSSVDGNDVITVFRETSAAVARARTGEGPTLIEMRTYRIRGHVETESAFLPWQYREVDEIEQWRERDPIRMLKRHLVEVHSVSPDLLDKLGEEAEATAEDALGFALSSPWPDTGEAETDVFAPGAAT